MRIDIIRPKFNTTQISHRNNLPKQNSPVVQAQNKTTKMVPPLGYFVSFNGYDEDKAFISSSKVALDNTMLRVIDYYNEENYEFKEALNILQNTDPQEYEKVIKSEKDFKTYENNFNLFNATTLKSIQDVQYGQAQLGEFWSNNSKIGNKKTIDIINSTIENKDNQDINETLKNLSYDKMSELRQNLIVEWFKNATETQAKFKGFIDKNNKELYKILEPDWGEFNTRKFLKQQESHYVNEFNKKTIDVILDPKASKEQKEEAVNTTLSYIEAQLKTEDAASMQSHLDTILEVQQHLKQGINKEMMSYAEEDFKKLHEIAITHWQKNTLPILINESLKRAIYINKAEKETPVMLTIPGYSELSLEQKFFVAKYYKANNNGLKDNNMLRQIIQDRDIADPSVIIDTISLKIESDKNKYFTQLDKFYDYLQNKEVNSNSEVPEISIPHRKDSFSFVNMYLFVLDKFEDFRSKPTKDKINYLSTLTQEELLLANNAIKEQWYQNEFQYLIETEVRKQAKYTSINTKMYDELKKININLNDIKVKLDNISFSLKDLLDNKYILKDGNGIKKVMQNSSTILADAERGYFEKPPEEQEEIDAKMRDSMPIIIDNLIQKTDDKDVIEELTFIKNKCKNPKTKSNEILNMLKVIAIGRTMSFGMNKGFNKLGGFLNPVHSISTLHSQLTDAGQIGADIIQNPDIGTGALNMISGGVATHAALSGGTGLPGIFSAIPPIDPITATIAVVVAAVGTGVVAAKKATKLERQQREIYVEFSK